MLYVVTALSSSPSPSFCLLLCAFFRLLPLRQWLHQLLNRMRFRLSSSTTCLLGMSRLAIARAFWCSCSGDEERDVPELHMDYCFMGKVDEKAQPILVVKERDTRMMCSMLVGEKEAVDEHVIKRIIEFIKELGYESAKIVLKSDQESSVKSVIDAVIRAKRDAPTMPEYSPVRSSGSNGVIERGIKEVQGQLRAMKSALDTRVGVDIRGTSK